MCPVLSCLTEAQRDLQRAGRKSGLMIYNKDRLSTHLSSWVKNLCVSEVTETPPLLGIVKGQRSWEKMSQSQRLERVGFGPGSFVEFWRTLIHRRWGRPEKQKQTCMLAPRDQMLTCQHKNTRDLSYGDPWKGKWDRPVPLVGGMARLDSTDSIGVGVQMVVVQGSSRRELPQVSCQEQQCFTTTMFLVSLVLLYNILGLSYKLLWSEAEWLVSGVVTSRHSGSKHSLGQSSFQCLAAGVQCIKV